MAILQSNHDKLMKLAELESDWDGEGAYKPSEHSLRLARNFLSSLPEDLQSCVSVAPLPDGRVEVEADFENGVGFLIDFPAKPITYPTNISVSFQSQ